MKNKHTHEEKHTIESFAVLKGALILAAAISIFCAGLFVDKWAFTLFVPLTITYSVMRPIFHTHSHSHGDKTHTHGHYHNDEIE